MNGTTAPNRAIWLLIFAAIASSTVIYGFVATMVTPEAGAAERTTLLRSLFPVVAAALLIASVVWTKTRARARREQTATGAPALPPPQEFQVHSIVGLALAEACAILGFVRVMVGAPALEYLPFGAATLLVMLLVHLPDGLSYWSEWESRPGGPMR